MRYSLEYVSQWTSFIVDTYLSIEDCERECAQRFDILGITFKRDQFGILTTDIYADETITLNLYEVERMEKV